jgi:hypothetical protein
MKQEILTIFITAVTISFVSLFWKDIMILTASLSILSIIALWHYHKKNDVIVYLIGAMIGVSAESVCIYFGAWRYSNPTFLIPIWLPLVWGLAALVIRRFDLEIENR